MGTLFSKKWIYILLALCAGLMGCQSDHPSDDTPKVSEIRARGTLLVGSTGDYRPLSYLDPESGQYWGFDVELAEIIANSMGVGVRYVPTSWPTLTGDMLQEGLFDMAICGITITDARKEIMLMSEGYLRNGKTILCRKSDIGKFQSLDQINRPDVRVMVNPGGLNEKFARANMDKSQIIVHQRNEEIPALIAAGEADVMITEIVEAPYYVAHDERLGAPLLDQPFTNGEIGVLLRQGDEDLLRQVNQVIETCKKDGTLRKLYEKYGFIYKY